MHGHKTRNNELQIADGSVIERDLFSHGDAEDKHEQGGGDQRRKDRLVRDGEKAVDLPF